MSIPNQIGLFLHRRDELALMCAVVIDCGLVPVTLNREEFRTALGPVTTSPAGTLLWIIADEHAAIRKPQTLQIGESFSADRIALLGLVRDPCREPEISSAPADLAYAIVLERPLHLDVVRAQLRQALRTARVLAVQHARMAVELSRARTIFDSLSSGVTICDCSLPDLPLVYVNPAFEKITGYSAAESCGRSCRFLQGIDTDQPGVTAVRVAIRNRQSTHALLRNYRRDGTPFWNELYMSPIFDAAGQVTHFVGFQNDVTQLVETTDKLNFLAHHDGLTGLANRGLLMEQLTHALPRARRNGKQVAVLFFDLNNFKDVNDTFGHDTGDALLRVVAERLRTGTRMGETVARLGGDEFIVVLDDITESYVAGDVKKRLVNLVSEPVEIFEQWFHPSTSVGMSIFPRDGKTAEALLNAADCGMYSNKKESQSVGENRTLSGPAPTI